MFDFRHWLVALLVNACCGAAAAAAFAMAIQWGFLQYIEWPLVDTFAAFGFVVGAFSAKPVLDGLANLLWRR